MLRLSTIPRTLAAVGTALVVTTPAMAAGAPGTTLVPFHATASGPYSIVVTPTHRYITGTPSGQATHLGHVTVADSIVVNATPVVVPDCPTLGTAEVFTGTLTAANGDTITVTGPGTGCPTGPTTTASMDELTVTGGTGRFEGATGDIHLRTQVDRATFTAVLTFDGTLSTPGANGR